MLAESRIRRTKAMVVASNSVAQPIVTTFGGSRLDQTQKKRSQHKGRNCRSVNPHIGCLSQGLSMPSAMSGFQFVKTLFPLHPLQATRTGSLVPLGSGHFQFYPPAEE